MTSQTTLPQPATAVDHSRMRPEVQAFIADGQLPDWDTDDEEAVDRRHGQLEAIPRPVTATEAAALAACFGPDDCFGVAWTLLHLIETAPGPTPDIPRPGADANDWHHVLWQRWGNPDDHDANLTR